MEATELGLTLAGRNASIHSDCMVEAVEVDVGWNGTSQTIGYRLSG